MSTMGLRGYATKPSKSRPQTCKPRARDNVKDLLIRKLMHKFARNQNAAGIINAKVSRFIQQTRLTEANLLKLEKEISEELKTAAGVKRQAAATTVPIQAAPKPESTAPLKSESVMIKSMKKEDSDLERDPYGIAQKVPYNDDKEWDAILRFNSELYLQELKQAEERKLQQKKFVKTELDKQMDEKMQIGKKSSAEFKAYQELEKTYLKTWDAREREKGDLLLKRKLDEKARLDKQFKEEIVRKRTADLENRQYEKTLVEKNKKELEDERLAQVQKKQLERSYHKKMLEENEVNKRKQLEFERQLREQEKKDLVEYTKVLDQQEADRADQVKGREKKTQELMNHMADTVIKDLDQKRAEEEKKVLKYQQEKELRDQLDDEQRIHRMKANQREMRRYLDRQTDDKRKKAMLEKEESKRIAETLKQEQRLQEDEERTVKQKVSSANKEHADYLRKQMFDCKKTRAGVMNREEYLMNRKVIEEIESHPRPKTAALSHKA